MVRRGARSRGCDVCKKRKMKCDEGSPECGQCLKSGRSCPGPVQGALFIDDWRSAQVSYCVKDDRFANPPEDVQQVNGAAENTSVAEQATRLRLPHNDEQLTPVAGSKTIAIPNLYQPEKGSMFQELFLDYFIHTSTSANRQRRHTDWVYQLSSFIQQPVTKSIIYAIRAATMALYGKKSGNESLQLEACRIYSRGLQSQIEESRASQAKITHGINPVYIFTEQDICAPILFCIFETSMSTAYDAWGQHLMAGCKILEMLGPEKCQQGMYHSLLRFVRAGAIYHGCMFNVPVVFASEKWRTIPFEIHPKVPLDYIFEILLQLPGCLYRSWKMKDAARRGDFALYEQLRLGIQEEAVVLLARLDLYWQNLQYSMGTHYTHTQYSELSDFTLDPQNWILTAPPTQDFGNPLNARTLTEHDAAIILIGVLLKASSFPNDNDRQNLRRMAIHSCSILDIVAWHDRLKIQGGDHNLVFAMKVVYQCSPSLAQQAQTEDRLAQWGSTRGVGGITNKWCRKASDPFIPVETDRVRVDVHT